MTDKYRVKQKLRLIALTLLLASCTSVKLRSANSKDSVYTMQTDVSRDSLSRAQYYMEMAEAYSLQEQNEKAIEYLRLSLLHDPKLVEAYIRLSDEYLKQHKYLLAMIELNDAEKLDPANPTIVKKTGDLYLNAKIYSKAREVYEKLLTLDHKAEEAQWALFYIFKLERKYADALSILVSVPVTDSNNYRIVFEKALLYKLLNEPAMYEAALAKSLALNPRDREVLMEYVKSSFSKIQFKEATVALTNYSNTHNFDLQISQNLAYAAVQSENYRVALREYEKQRPFSDEISMTELRMAHVYYLMNDFENAEKYYLKLINRDDMDEAKFYLAQIYIRQNKEEDAAFVLGKLMPSSEFYGEARSRLALFRKSQGDQDEAINVISDAFLHRADQIAIYKTYADFLIGDKKYVEALALLERGIQQFPKDEDLRLKMAFLHYRLNNQKSFKKQIMAALKINPQSAGAYSMLAELWYLKNKNVDEIVHFIKIATELKSTNTNIKPILAWALMQKNQSTEAVAIFEEYYEGNPQESFFARSLSQVYSRGGVKEKAKELSQLADRLEASDSLKSRFIFKDSSQQVQSQDYLQTPTRLPSSLENH